MYKPKAQVRLRDARRQNRLAERLRAVPEEQAFRWVRRLIAIEPDAGLRLANRSIRSKHLVESLLADGLYRSNATTVRIWIKHLWRRIGPLRTIELIREQAATNPEIALKAAYWLPVELGTADKSVTAELVKIKTDFPTVADATMRIGAAG